MGISQRLILLLTFIPIEIALASGQTDQKKCKASLQGQATLAKAEAIENPFFDSNYTRKPEFRSTSMWHVRKRLDQLERRMGKYERERAALQKKLKLSETAAAFRAGELHISELPSTLKPERLNRYLLTERDRRLINKKIDVIEAQIALLEETASPFVARLEKINKSERAAALNYIGQLSEIPEFAREFREYLSLARLLMSDNEKMVTLLVGHPFSKPNSSTLNAYKSVATKLLEQGYTVLYDADSVGSSKLAALSQEKMIGISAHSKRRRNSRNTILSFQNIYFRMRAFSASKRVVASPSSVLGTALQVYNRVTDVYSPTGGKFRSLQPWSRYLSQKGDDYDLGIRFSDIDYFDNGNALLKKVLETEGVVKKLSTKKAVEFPTQMDRTWHQLAGLSYSELDVRLLEDALAYVFGIFRGKLAMEGVGGAAVFGSARDKTWLVESSEAMARHLVQQKLAVITGGSSGVMEFANRGAFQVGGYSVGIPIMGHNRMATETRFPTHVHTQTVPSHAYSVRIPLLIDDRKTVAFMPGGNGTMQELTVTLMRLAERQRIAVVFQNIDYYAPLFNWLRDVLPREISSQMKLIDKPK